MVFSGIKHRGMPSKTMDEVASVVAQKNAMERPFRTLAHGCRLFQVEKGWESAMLGRDLGIARCDSLLSFEAALRNPDVRSIFIPLGAPVSEKDIEKICHRNGVGKMLFREVEKA